MEKLSGRKSNKDGEYDVVMTGNPSLVTGKIGNAVRFGGNGQYATLGEHRESCLGNLDYCQHGLLLAFWLRPGFLKEDMQYMSTGQNGVKMWYSNNQMHCSLETTARRVELSFDDLHKNQWSFLEFSWHPEKGLDLYIDNEFINSTQEVSAKSQRERRHNESRDRIYLGRGEREDIGVSGNVTVDELEYWYADRDYLLAFDYIDRGNPGI